MLEFAEQDGFQIEFLWVQSYYDGPLKGLCKYNNEICYFEVKDEVPYEEDDEQFIKMVYSIYKLTVLEKIKWLWKKKLFELCVGYHYTYPQRKNKEWFYYRKPVWLYRFIFCLYYWNWRNYVKR